MAKQLTKNFNWSEFQCKDGSEIPGKYWGFVQELAANLQVIRDVIGKPIIINSGYRTVSYNHKIGGVKNSQHLYAKAVDIHVKNMSSLELYHIILDLIKAKKIHNGGLGLYNTFVHYDIRSFSSRWDYRN